MFSSGVPEGDKVNPDDQNNRLDIASTSSVIVAEK
jgi:hypothetical protein